MDKEWTVEKCPCGHESCKELLRHAEAVMKQLEEHGGAIVPHLLDTDDNPGEFLRQAIYKAKTGADADR